MTADILIRNARVHTMDPDTPLASAVALSGNKILAVGSDDEVMAQSGPDTRIVDGQGATLLPGFNDAHVHLFGGSVGLTALSLDGVREFDELKDKILSYAAEHPDQLMLTADYASYALLGADVPLTRHHLDDILPDRAIFLCAPDGHTGWANTAALKLAGILEGKALSVGNHIVMGPDGLALGELQESEAMAPVRALAPTGGREGLGMASAEPGAVSAEERAADIVTIKHGLRHLAENGITSIQNMDGNHYQLELLQEIERSEGLPVRVRYPFHYKNFHSPADLETTAVKWRDEFNDDRIRCDFVKMFIDGVIESGTAVMAEPYADDPTLNGDPLFSQEALDAAVAEADRLGMQVAIHSIGDMGVHMVIDAYEKAAKANGTGDRRHRIEHIESILPEDIARIPANGILASMQPLHGQRSGATYLPKLGEARAQFAFAAKQIAEAGAYMVYSTDWPVMPVDPMFSLWAAVTDRPWFEGHRNRKLTLDESLAAYTRGGAYAEFMEDRKGMLKPGYYADLVLLSGDLHATDPEEFTKIRPVLTVCDGQVTYEA